MLDALNELLGNSTDYIFESHGNNISYTNATADLEINNHDDNNHHDDFHDDNHHYHHSTNHETKKLTTLEWGFVGIGAAGLFAIASIKHLCFNNPGSTSSSFQNLRIEMQNLV